MRPKRPDSAKTQQTKKTIDSSEQSKRELNSSKFSQTFSSGVNSFHEKTDQFKQYVAQKDKDPKFKHLKSKLQTIQQKPAGTLKQSKTSFKPFERKKQKTTEKTNKKVEEKPPVEQLSLSRGFAEKNKQKMNSLKLAIAQQKQQEKDKEDKNKPKIKFDAFKLNVPGQKKQQNKETKPQQKKQQNNITKQPQPKPSSSSQQRKTKKTEQQIARQQYITNLQMYVSQVQARNMQDFPANYDQLLTVNIGDNNIQDLQKINLNDFLTDPTEEDYESIRKKIKVLDQQLQSDKLEQSIDLQEIIAGQDQQQQQQEKQRLQNEQQQSFLGSISTLQLKKRNAFITQILAGKISKHQIDQIQQMNKSSMKIYKIQHEKQEEQEEVEFPQINMVKRQTNRLLQRNRIQASGQIYRDCDYLSQEHKKRLEQLLSSDPIQSPFQFDDLEKIKHRRIEEGIRMYRQMAQSQQSHQVINQDNLPKDPELRKQAQKNMIRQKMNNVNQRLSDVDKIVVTKAKIQNLIKRYEHTRASASYQSLCQQNQAKFDQQLKKIREAETMISSLTHRENLDQIIQQIQLQYRQLQGELKQMREIDQRQLNRMQKQRLKRKYRQVQQIQSMSNQYRDQIQEIQRLKNDVVEQLKMYDQIQRIQIDTLQCEGFKQNQTIQDIDAWIIHKIQTKQDDQHINK